LVIKFLKMKTFNFNQEEKDKIKLAVANLEQATSGELVLYYARKSDDYPGAGWKFAAIIGGSAAFIIGLLSYLWMLPPWLTPMIISILMLSLMIVAYLLAVFVPDLRISLSSTHIVSQRVLTKARDIFLEEEIFKTADRIGILFFISELEQKVVVLGDSGINSKISKEDWTHIVDTIVLGIKHQQIAQGIVNSVAICQDLLLKHGFTNIDKAENELSDDIRIEE
jgi:putative membrane protein